MRVKVTKVTRWPAVTWCRSVPPHWRCAPAATRLNTGVQCSSSTIIIIITTTTTIMMITRVRSAVSSIIGGIMASGSSAQEIHPDPPPRFPYSRPDFLALSPDEVECSADHISRPILILKEMKLPWATGYAEWVATRWFVHADAAECLRSSW